MDEMEVHEERPELKILNELDELWDLLLQCRSVFPTLGKNLIGQWKIVTAPYYRTLGYNAEIQLDKPITEDTIKANRRLGKWINENAIIHLNGIMDYHGFLKKIDKGLSAWREVDLMRRMRNAFTKTPLNYRPEDPENIRLREKVIKYFVLQKEDFPEDEIPTPIDTVVAPIFRACRNYITAKTAANNKQIEADRNPTRLLPEKKVG